MRSGVHVVQAITQVALLHGILRSIHLLSCTYNTSYVRIPMLFNIFLHPSRSPASQLLPR
jgi:hypothetical protein